MTMMMTVMIMMMVMMRRRKMIMMAITTGGGDGDEECVEKLGVYGEFWPCRGLNELAAAQGYRNVCDFGDMKE